MLELSGLHEVADSPFGNPHARSELFWRF